MLDGDPVLAAEMLFYLLAGGFSRNLLPGTKNRNLIVFQTIRWKVVNNPASTSNPTWLHDPTKAPIRAARQVDVGIYFHTQLTTGRNH